MSVVQDRLRWLYTQKGVAYVAIYGNQGKEARSIVNHPHLHMMSFSIIPPRIEEEADFSHKILNENGVYPLSQIINKEDLDKYFRQKILLLFPLGHHHMIMNFGFVRRNTQQVFQKFLKKKLMI